MTETACKILIHENNEIPLPSNHIKLLVVRVLHSFIDDGDGIFNTIIQRNV